MITFPVGSYQVKVLTGSNKPVWLYLSDTTGKYRGYITFRKDYSGDNNFTVHSNGIINAYMSLDKFDLSLDILRNEKPVYFAVNEEYNWAALQTGLEPTGEEETTL